MSLDKKVVFVSPEDDENIPYQEDCERCKFYKDNPDPSAHKWIWSLAEHMDYAHNLILMESA